MGKLNEQLQQVVERTKKDYEKKESVTIQQCSIELYEVSDSYDCKSVLQKLKTYCEDVKAQYVIAFHDNDFYSENTFDDHKRLVGLKGDKKANHYHCVIHLPYRIKLSDLAIRLGIEDRWIMIIKRESGFDEMIWYVTHEAYPSDIKTHYEYQSFDTNIMDYVEWLVNAKRTKLEQGNKNIVHDFIEIVDGYDKKISYQQFYQIFQGLEYGINDVKQYYQMLKDIMMSHNAEQYVMENTDNIVDRKFIEAKAKDKNMMENLEKTVDSFGCVTIDDNGKKYVLTNAQIKRKD